MREEKELAVDFRGRARCSEKQKVKEEEEGVLKDATERYRKGRSTQTAGTSWRKVMHNLWAPSSTGVSCIVREEKQGTRGRQRNLQSACHLCQEQDE